MSPRPFAARRAAAPLALLAGLAGVAASGVAAPLAAQVGAPAGPVPPALLEARRAALLERLGTGVAVLRSGEVKSIEGDYPQDSDYRERNDFFYLTGLEVPGSYLVLVARESAPDQVILYVPARDSVAERWTGPKLGPGPEATALTGIADVRPADSAATQVPALVRESGVRGGDDSARGALYVEPVPESETPELLGTLLARTPARAAPAAPAAHAAASPSDSLPAGVESLADEVAALRLVKDADELRRLRRAIDITSEAHRAAMRAVRPGMYEYEIEAVIEFTFRRLGAERVGFPSIVGSGPNSTTLHYDKNRRRTEAGDLVVADIGAEYGYYSADVTRTFPVSGRFTPRQRQLYDLVLATQQAAIDAVRPGASIGELNRVARTYMREHSGSLCAPVTCDRYFVHGLSHWLGMDVHDVGSYRTALVPGMVLTIEPGIYIPAERIGIRIEDDVLVTTGAPEILSAGAPRRAEDIERVMAEGRR